MMVHRAIYLEKQALKSTSTLNDTCEPTYHIEHLGLATQIVKTTRRILNPSD